MLNRVSRTTGSTQLGFLTMSSNVAFGEKNTPTIRPIGLIAGCDCASGAGMDAVAIEVPPPRSALAGACYRRSTPPYAQTPEKISDSAAARSRRLFGVRWLATAFITATSPRRSGTPARCQRYGVRGSRVRESAHLRGWQFRHSSEQLPRI